MIMIAGMNLEVYKNILSANLQRNASKLIGRNFIMQQDNDPKHTANTTKDFIREKKWNVLDWPSQSPDHRPNWACISPPEEEIEGTPPPPPPKQTTTERGCRVSLEKHHKRRMQHFGNVNGLLMQLLQAKY